MKELLKKARAYALKNAIHYNGKANVNAVISGLFAEGLKKEEIKEIEKKVSEVVSKVNKLLLKKQKKEFKKIEQLISHRKVREGLPELPNADKGVVMRIAPSPSGALHVGHALTACISFDYVQKYSGTFYVRVEDTNPENIYPPAYKLIEEDSKWLFDKKAKFVVQSDRMEIYYKYAEKLIKKKAAYVCTCSGDEFRKFSSEKKNCPCRKLNEKENLERWKKMLDTKGYLPGEAVLRFKSNMKDENPAMRDFPLARINLKKHPRQKNKYRVWPLMNLSVTVDDIEMKMTHIIRAKDHRDNAKRQKKIYKVLGKKYPWENYLGLWKFSDMDLSSTKITKGIKEGKYSGWDDEKLPTVSALRKKGYKPEAFWKLSEYIGLSENDKIIDKKRLLQAPRHI